MRSRLPEGPEGGRGAKVRHLSWGGPGGPPTPPPRSDLAAAFHFGALWRFNANLIDFGGIPDRAVCPGGTGQGTGGTIREEATHSPILDIL